MCGDEARLYMCGPRCDEHSPAAHRTPTRVPAASEQASDCLFDLTPIPKLAKTRTTRSAKTAPDPDPTGQQTAVIDAFRSGQDLVIEAGAGAGKTSTLRMCANADKRRGAYIVFGRANAAEAKRKFPANVVAKTAHGFAFATLDPERRDRVFRSKGRVRGRQVAEILGINEAVSLANDLPLVTPRQLACLTIDTVRRYTHSADPEIDGHHVPRFRGLDKPSARAALATIVVPYARKAWDDLVSVNGRLRFEPDHYLKMWSLTEPQFDADYVLLDEAQDADPAIAFVVNGQRNSQRIMVGDQCQSIFQWRGAINAMGSFAGQRLPLSQSFRFGHAIADEANKWLDVLSSPLRLTGFDPIPSQIGRLTAADAILCRTNGQTIAEISDLVNHGHKVALAGGGGGLKSMAEAAADLQMGKGTDHPELYAFRTWDEVRAYVNEEEDGADLRTFVSLVESLGADQVLGLVDSLVDERRADVVISTAHKAKGREWGTVRIANDFPPPKKSEDDPDPEIPPTAAMLAYVAVTRAQRVLDRGGLAWIDKWVAA